VGRLAARRQAQWRRRAARVELPGLGPALVLVLAPHPDNETIMCGAAVATLRRRGDDVRVSSVTCGAATTVGVPTGALGDAVAATDIGASRAAEPRVALGDGAAANAHRDVAPRRAQRRRAVSVSAAARP
jgi:hypothetical protein